MSSLSKAQSRVRNTRGVSFLTKNGDDFDHRGLRKARRSMGNAVIEEWLEEDETPSSPFMSNEGPLTFRVVISTQVYENYGAHAWDGKGECPQYWKAKGGDDFQRDIGDWEAVTALGSAGVEAIVEEMRKLVGRNDESFRVWCLGWCLVPSNERTPGENYLDEMRKWGWLTDVQYEARLARLTTVSYTHLTLPTKA